MRPTAALCQRTKSRSVGFTTKQVGKGFYRGNRTGSMGAHTPTGGYLIDWRKVRHFVVPDLVQAKLTPFVNASDAQRLPLDPLGKSYDARYDGMQFLKWFRTENSGTYAYEMEEAARRRASEGNPTEPISDFESENQAETLLIDPKDDLASSQQQNTVKNHHARDR